MNNISVVPQISGRAAPPPAAGVCRSGVYLQTQSSQQPVACLCVCVFIQPSQRKQVCFVCNSFDTQLALNGDDAFTDLLELSNTLSSSRARCAFMRPQ